ncbi:MAG: amidohydrolase family protein [Pseudomonadota bacterium]|nr:amidohydrolase family protein [Pseudomonadota bacterium]
MVEVTVIRNAAWVVKWDVKDEKQVYIRDADVAFSETEIVHVGGRYNGDVTNEIDGRDRLVIPGLIDLHAHPATEPLNKGYRDETRSPAFRHTPLYEHLYILRSDEAGTRAALTVAIGEMLLSGVTTAVYLGQAFLGQDLLSFLDLLARTGPRVYVAPMYRDATWRTDDGHSVNYDWDHDAGRGHFETAIGVIEAADRHPSGRLHGMLAPAQVDTCSAERLSDSAAYAKEHGVPLQIHAGQSPTEFHEMVRRHGHSPIRMLHDLGVLGPRTIIGHGIFLDHHPWLHWPTGDDVSLIADANASVAHCPVEFVRRGMALHTFNGYREAGVNLGIGTDTYPHDLLHEMLVALYAARAVAGTVDAADTAGVFEAATVGGANALGRNDLGRIAPGCRADLVLVDLTEPNMMPVREPLRSLIYVAGSRAVRDVFVDGCQVVADGQVTTVDIESALLSLQEAQCKAIPTVPEIDWANRSLDELAPMTLPVRPLP